MKLKELREIAKGLGLKIEAEKDDFGWGYWLIHSETREGIWEDDNFCTSLSEVEYKLNVYAAEKGV